MKSLLPVIVLFLCVQLITAQDLNIPTKSWKITKIGIQSGQDIEMPNNMDHRYLLSTSKNPTIYDYSALDFNEQHVESMACDNPNVRLTLAAAPTAWEKTEFQVSAVGIFDRLDMIHFVKDDGNDFQELQIDVISNEIALEVGVVHYVPITKCIRFFGGAGTNFGYSFGGRMDITGDVSVVENTVTFSQFREDPSDGQDTERTIPRQSIRESQDISDGIHQRAYVQVGFSATLLKQLEFVLDWRGGIGYRNLFNSPLKGTTIESTNLGFFWRFGDVNCQCSKKARW